jgi:hypothetical protein
VLARQPVSRRCRSDDLVLLVRLLYAGLQLPSHGMLSGRLAPLLSPALALWAAGPLWRWVSVRIHEVDRGEQPGGGPYRGGGIHIATS